MRTTRSVTASVVAFLLVTAVGVAAAGAGTDASGKPLIGKPVVAPAHATAGKPLSVSYRVTRNGAPLAAAALTFTSSVGGRAIAHTGSFRAGVARERLVVPATAGGRLLRLRLTVRAGGRSATSVTTLAIRVAGLPTLAVGDSSTVEGSGATTMLSFPVRLSTASDKIVTVSYTTADGTATAPGDYTPDHGTLTFAAGKTLENLVVVVAGDIAMETDESLSVSLSDPSNATIARATAMGTITNDDTEVPLAAGDYKGATQEGNYVFFSLQPNRSMTGFRTNNISEDCGGGWTFAGSVSWGTRTIPIGADGGFVTDGSWSGSDTFGDTELTGETWTVKGSFASPTTVSGTISMTDDMTFHGTHYHCTSTVTWTAARVG